MTTIRDLADRIRSLKLLPQRVAVRAAPLVEQALRANAAAGLDPMGKPWKLKKDGGKPLKNVAAKISCVANGKSIVATLTGPDVFHHRGTKDHPRRQVLPRSGEVPDFVKKAIDEAVGIEFAASIAGQR